MTSALTWNTLSAADSKDLVLCADFGATGRPEAGFPDLVARIDHDATFWHVVPPAVEPGAGLGGAAYVRAWLEPVRASGLTVRAVMGYCVGAVYAAELASALTALQDEVPEIIVFDPEPTSMDTIRYQFGKIIGMLSSILDDEDSTEIRTATEQLLQVDGITVEGYASELYLTFRKVGERAFVRAGLDREHGAEMWGLFSSFLSYLSYADQLDPKDGWLRATALSSSSPRNGLNQLPEDARDGVVGRELRFDEGHDELLRSDDVARAVTELLGERR